MRKLDIDNETEYTIRASNDKTFFDGMQAHVLLNGNVIGIFGIVHPDVLNNFHWFSPTSVLELTVEPLIDFFFEKKFG